MTPSSPCRSRSRYAPASSSHIVSRASRSRAAAERARRPSAPISACRSARSSSATARIELSGRSRYANGARRRRPRSVPALAEPPDEREIAPVVEIGRPLVRGDLRACRSARSARSLRGRFARARDRSVARCRPTPSRGRQLSGPSPGARALGGTIRATPRASAPPLRGTPCRELPRARALTAVARPAAASARSSRPRALRRSRSSPRPPGPASSRPAADGRRCAAPSRRPTAPRAANGPPSARARDRRGRGRSRRTPSPSSTARDRAAATA